MDSRFEPARSSNTLPSARGMTLSGGPASKMARRPVTNLAQGNCLPALAFTSSGQESAQNKALTRERLNSDPSHMQPVYECDVQAEACTMAIRSFHLPGQAQFLLRIDSRRSAASRPNLRVTVRRRSIFKGAWAPS